MSAPALALVALFAAATPDAGRAIPLYFDRPVSAADLKGKSLRELSFVRNTIFARAGQVFRKPWVRDYFLQFDWYKPTGLDPKKLSKLDTDNAAAIAKYEIAIPTEELTRRMAALESKFKDTKTPLPPDDMTELVLLAEALGKTPEGAIMASMKNADGPRDPLLDLSALDKLLTIDQLNEKSKRDLRILRNTIFARRGRAFVTPTMHDYFETKAWYHADPKYTDKRLTKIDLANIKLIRSVEDSIGGAEVEGGEPDAFMGAA